ncbi:MAG: methyltransferase domain-containing protein [Acidobacteria bacterium]|nr:methyltransferase domain-containing protein [Acidobacteriota bacterium]
MTADSKQAEKAYLGRTGGNAWEREKPFSPPGDDTLDDSIELLHDFAVALRLLEPERGDLIADLGAGGGWCSDLLQRLNRKSIAIDISLEMLRVSRQRDTRTPIRAAAADLERLPFVDGAFDKAICLNALHHIPSMSAAVAEISRVLSPRGVAVFSEPGAGHADMPASRAATRDFGVLEQEVLIEPFIETCFGAGFVDVRVCPIAYVIPDFDLSLDEWRAWKRLPRTKRPLRAAEKMWRAVLEFAGAGKQSVLFEEAFAMRLVRLFQQPVEEHPFIVAAKYTRVRRPGALYRAAIRVEACPSRVKPGEPVVASLSIENTGSATWAARPAPGGTASGHVRVGIQLLDATGRVTARDFARIALDADVRPGDASAVQTNFAAPDQEGEYELKFDLVAEGVTWFEPTGSAVETRRLSVGP